MDDFLDLEPEDIFAASDERIAQLLTLQVDNQLLRDRIIPIVDLVKVNAISNESLKREIIKLAWDCYMEGFNEGVCK